MRSIAFCGFDPAKRACFSNFDSHPSPGTCIRLRMKTYETFTVKSVALAVIMLLACLNFSGCLVAGYSSGGGLWIWPGSLVLTGLLVLFLVLRRR
jgi:hypothetical protein